MNATRLNGAATAAVLASLLATPPLVEAHNADGHDWENRMKWRAMRLLDACLGGTSHSIGQHFDDEPVYLHVSACDKLNEEEAWLAAESEFLRARIATTRKWRAGQLATTISVSCSKPIRDRPLLYSTVVTNGIIFNSRVFMDLGDLGGTYGSVGTDRAQSVIMQNIRDAARDAATWWLKEQQQIKASKSTLCEVEWW